jgi:NAD(P)-dependent dehydrogenase (short-subunit alcohol dehydrogenase family)
MKNPFDLTGRVALITGGSKGLGKAMARGLAEAGADIVIASRTENELKESLAEILYGTEQKGYFLVTDLSKRENAGKLVADTLSLLDRINILINNAGTNRPQAIDEIDDATWDEVLELNLSSIMALTRQLFQT